jgi:predicted TIM-barrel fold metal-dependent hydrolase
VPLVLDHFAMVPEAVAEDDARLDLLLSLLRSGQAYVKLSAPYRLASTPAVADALAARLAALYVKTNPGRLLWGSDWPHTNREPGKGAHETSAYRQLAPGAMRRGIESWLPDASVRRQVLVENPASLYGF